MRGTSREILTVIVAMLALALAACGGADAGARDADGAEETAAAGVDGDHADEGDHAEEGEGDHSEEAFPFGEPAEGSEADRTIAVDANDSLTFGPASFDVEAGESVTFVVTNTGSIPHDFTLGDQAAQEAHEAEMAEGGMGGHDDPNVVLLQPGETKELTWSFTEPGTVMIGCHQPGHYAGGMRATIAVKA